MADEQEGPYKVVGTISTYREGPNYQIVIQKKTNFLQVVIPDAGTAETARQVCNLLNKQFKEGVVDIYGPEWRKITNDAVNGPDVPGLPDPDQRTGDAGYGIPGS